MSNSASPTEPVRVPAEHFGLTPDHFDPDAIYVCCTLQDAGFQAYLVGGCVRDTILGLNPKDADVSTSATPQEIKPLFKRCMLIGRRFRLAHVYFGRHIIEVATFRAAHTESGTEGQTDRDGMLVRDNVFGTVEEDALRRDFSINALLYDPVNNEFIDYIGGLEDLHKKELHSIGDPDIRFQEDPVRILRAIRFDAKCGIAMTPEIHQAIKTHAHRLSKISKARLFEEYKKLFLTGNSIALTHTLRNYDCFDDLFPGVAAGFDQKETQAFFESALNNTDERVKAGKSVHPAFLLAVFLWPRVREAHQALLKKPVPHEDFEAFTETVEQALYEQRQALSIPKRMTLAIKEIWQFQSRLELRKPRYIFRTLEHPRFRAAYDFLLLRQALDAVDPTISQWWTDIQTQSFKAQKDMIQLLRQDKKQ